MSHVPHEIRDEFPEYDKQYHELKISDAHFQKLTDEYHVINREIHRIEIGEDHVSQFDEENLRKSRMRLKDEIYARLKAV